LTKLVHSIFEEDLALAGLGIAVKRQPSAAMLCRVFWQIAPEVIEAGIRE
jgi:hypothetical protein